MDLQITQEFKDNVLGALLANRSNYSGSDAAYAKQWNINKTVYSRLINGDKGNLLRDPQWLNIGRELGISMGDRNFKVTRTSVLDIIEEEVMFCKANSKAMMFVDDSEIGKTVAAKYLSRTLKNCFYVDGSQCKTKQRFTRVLAKTLGLDSDGKYIDIKEDIKYYLKMLPNPVIIIDDGGDLKLETFLDIKEYWNSSEGYCGWYLIGDDSLENMIEKGIRTKKPGFRAFFSRFSSTYSSITPKERSAKVLFYQSLISTVLTANMDDKTNLNKIVSRCLKHDENGHIGGLRRAESLLILHS